MQHLAQMADYKFGFAKDGKFYFVDRVFENSSDFILDLDAADSLKFKKPTIRENIKEVYNLVKIIPRTVFLQPPEWDLRLVTREAILKGEPQTENIKIPFDSEILVQQKDDQRKTLSLECVVGGLVSEGKVSMKYRSLDEIFETRLSAVAAVAATSIKINNGIIDVRAGDTIRLEGDGVNGTRTVKTDPTDSEKEDGTIQLNTGLTNAYLIGDFVEITHNLSKWSDQRNNLLRDPYFDIWVSSNLDDWTKSDGNIEDNEDTTTFRYGKRTARLNLTGGTDSHIYQDIVGSKFSGDTRYTVTADVKCFEGDDTDNRADEIELKVTGVGSIVAEVSKTSTSTDWRNISVTFTTKSSPANVRIQLHIKGTSTTHGWVDGCFVMEGDVAIPDVLLLRNNSFIVVPNASVEVKFVPADPDSDGTLNETEMLPGDRLIITCPGLTLQQEENSVITAINITSRSRYGERTYPEINNPYLSRSLGRDISRRILNDFAFPKYKIDFESQLLPHIDFITSNNKVTTITLKSRKLFSTSPNWEERCLLLNVTDRLIGSSSFSLRSLEKI